MSNTNRDIEENIDYILWEKGLEIIQSIYRLMDQLIEKDRWVLRIKMIEGLLSITHNLPDFSPGGSKNDYFHFVYSVSGMVNVLESYLESKKHDRTLDEEEKFIEYLGDLKIKSRELIDVLEELN